MRARYISSLLLVLCIITFTGMNSVLASGAEQDTQNIRVGYFEFAFYHEKDENGKLSGYGYDFLQLLSRYEDISYTYVGYENNWSEMLQMLERGEIDMLTFADKTEGRLRQFCFSDYSIGSSSTILTVKTGNDKIVPGNYSTYDGLRIGTVPGNSRNESLERFAAKNNFTYTPVYYKTVSQLTDALEAGTVDAIVSSNMRMLKDEYILDTFDKSDFYVITRKDNTELMSLINSGIKKLNMYEPGWELTLRNKNNMDDILGTLGSTQEELDYLNELADSGYTLKVAVNPDRYPYSWFEDGTARGILPDLFEIAVSNLGIKYEYMIVPDRPSYMKIVENGDADICIDFHDDFYDAEALGYKITDSYLDTSFSWIQRRDFHDPMETITMIYSSSTISAGRQERMSDSNFLYFDTSEECLDAVLSGIADGYCTYTYQAERFLFDDLYNELTISLSSFTASFNVAVRADFSCSLLTLINKGVKTLSDSTVTDVIRKNTDFGEQKFSFIRMYHEYPSLFIFIIICTLIVVLLFTWAHVQSKYRVQLKIALDRAREASKAKTQFLANMSHDIRTPMNAIVGLTEIAGMNGNDMEDLKRKLEQIKAASSQLMSIINDVLDMSTIESGKFVVRDERFNIYEQSTNVISVIRTQAEAAGLTLVSDDIHIEHPLVIGDTNHINRVVLNLLNNAVKFCNPGGEVSISINEKPCDNPDYMNLVIKVSDDGVGIDKGFLERIFDPFEREQNTTVSKVEGTGLGLSITKNIVDMMHGTISIESEKNVGTDVTVEFPLKLYAPDDDQCPGENEIPQFLAGRRAMVVDDNEINLEIAATMIEAMGLEVECFSSGAEAAAAVADSPSGFYDIIFMDIMMPDMDGYEVVRHIRSLGTDYTDSIPIIAITANAFSEDKKKVLCSGMNEHIAKPFEFKHLREVIIKYLK